MTMLAVRPLEGYTTMGRETFLAKVTWENDWPVVNAGVGRLTDQVEINLPQWLPEQDPDSYTSRSRGRNAVPGSDRSYDFTRMASLGDEFLYLRNPELSHYKLEAGKGLYLTAASVTLKEQGSPSYVGIRQQHHAFRMEAALAADQFRCAGKSGDVACDCRAGLALLQSNKYHLRLEINQSELQVILCRNGQDTVAGFVPLPAPQPGNILRLYLQVDGLRATAGYTADHLDVPAAENLDIRSLSTEVAGGFVGCTAGIYAVTGEETETCRVLFTGLSYESK